MTEEMTTKASHVTNESLESTKRMVQMTNDSLNAGVKTMTMLEEQGETLQNVERETNQIKQDMKQARTNLNELSKCCGLCLCPCNRVKSTKSDCRKTQVRESKQSKQKVVSSQPTSDLTGPYVQRITNDEREEEMEENISQVVHHIEILKNMALDLSNKIEDQIQIIDHVNSEITTITSDVAAAEKEVRKHQ